MTLSGLLDHCRALGVELFADGPRLRYRAPAAAVDAELLADIAAHKVELLERCCRSCRRLADAGGRCWGCNSRPCADCGRPTGSAFIARCVPCGLSYNGNAGEPL